MFFIYTECHIFQLISIAQIRSADQVLYTFQVVFDEFFVICYARGQSLQNYCKLTNASYPMK